MADVFSSLNQIQDYFIWNLENYLYLNCSICRFNCYILLFTVYPMLLIYMFRFTPCCGKQPRLSKYYFCRNFINFSNPLDKIVRRAGKLLEFNADKLKTYRSVKGLLVKEKLSALSASSVIYLLFLLHETPSSG